MSARAAGAIEFLEEDGFECYVHADCGIIDLVMQAVCSSLKRSGSDGSDIDAVIVATESRTVHGPKVSISQFSEDVNRALFKAGLSKAHPYGNALSTCANFGTSLALAHALLVSGRHSNVMVVMADHNGADSASRIMRDGAAVYSDVAAACMVDVVPGEFLIRHIVNRATPSLLVASGGQQAQQNVEFLEIAREFELLVADRTGRRLRDYPLVVSDNVHSTFLTLMCKGMGFDPRALVAPSKREVAHANSADGLLSLAQLKSEGRLKPGDKLGILNFGMSLISFVEVEVRRDGC